MKFVIFMNNLYLKYNFLLFINVLTSKDKQKVYYVFSKQNFEVLDCSKIKLSSRAVLLVRVCVGAGGGERSAGGAAAAGVGDGARVRATAKGAAVCAKRARPTASSRVSDSAVRRRPRMQPADAGAADEAPPQDFHSPFRRRRVLARAKNTISAGQCARTSFFPPSLCPRLLCFRFRVRHRKKREKCLRLSFVLWNGILTPREKKISVCSLTNF